MRGWTSMLRERRGQTTTTTMEDNSSSNNNNNDATSCTTSTPRLGVRRTSSGVRQRTTATTFHHSSSHSNLNGGSNHSHSHGMNGSSHNHNARTTPTRSKLFDALTHPAQAAAAAAAIRGQNVPGRKRKSCSLFVLTLMCLGVVHYAGNMYDHDHYDGGGGERDSLLLAEQDAKQKARLRNRSPSSRGANHDHSPDNNHYVAAAAGRGGGATTITTASTSTSTTPDSTTTKSTNSSWTAWMNQWTNNNNNQKKQNQQLTSSSSSLRKQQTGTSLLQDSTTLLQQRISNAIKAAFVVDAASMGTHWIYNPKELTLVLTDLEKPEFRNPPESKFYSSRDFPGHYHHGQSSPYGEQLMFATQYVAEQLAPVTTITTNIDSNTDVDNDDDDSSDASDPGSLMEPMSRAMQQWAETFGGRADQATLEFLSCRRKKVHAQMMEQKDDQQATDDNDNDNDDGTANNNNDLDGACGANDDQAHFFLKVIPMTCLYVGHPHRRQYVEQAIRVHQNHDQAVLFGLALSDLLERVLLMDYYHDFDNHNNDNNSNNDNDNVHMHHPNTLQQALDATLQSLQEEHTDGWLHFALSLTQHHQQHDALVDAWIQARDNVDLTLAQLSEQVGRSCHMPGALILTLQALYRAAQLETSSASSSSTASSSTISTKPTSSLTHLHRGYDYYVKALLSGFKAGANNDPKTSSAGENEQLIAAVRDNIMAAGDTCSRAIFMGAILGAAYGEPPQMWWHQMNETLAKKVSEASDIIAQYASRRLSEQWQLQKKQLTA